MMKQFFATVILLITSQISQADATLTVKIFDRQDSSQLLTYYIKDGKVRISEDGSKRTNIYDEAEQHFLSIDQASGNISRIDKDILRQRVETLNKQRLEKLVEVESGLQEKLKTMDEEEKMIAESLVNQLKYPEFYGAHTFIKVEQTEKNKTIQGVPCQVYIISRKDIQLKQICMASAQALGLSAKDYQSLRNFYHFNYNTQTQLLLAMGKTGFTHIDYEQENMPGIPIEVISLDQNGNKTDLLLESLSIKPIDKALFNHKISKK